MSTRPLSSSEKQTLEASVEANYRILWLEGFSKKLRTAKLMFSNAKLRLTMPEAYEVHRSVIQWKAKYSTDRVPDQALGVDPLTAALMRWVMQSWERVEFFNKFLAGTWAPRIQMGFIPGLACAAHFLIVAKQAPANLDDLVAAGQSVQRFWLTLTQLGLVMQPEITPLIFSRYVREGIRFSRTQGLHELASSLATQLGTLVGERGVRSACSWAESVVGRQHPRGQQDASSPT